MTDKIILTGIQFYGYHGCSEEERKLGQHFEVDVELYIDLRSAGKSDNIDETVDYVEVYEEIERIVTGKSRKLIETVSEEIADRILSKFSRIEAIEITLRKNSAPFKGNMKSAAVKIRRSRDNH